MANKYKYDDEARALIEARFLESLRRHVAGWQEKVEQDFSRQSFLEELANLEGDEVYHNFRFARPEYVLVRLMGRMSISIGRRLGEMYDKLPRLVAAARFGLSVADVVEQFDGLELDLALRKRKVLPQDQRHFEDVVEAWFSGGDSVEALAIEIRYNFNPNDSARLRKDVRMVELAQDAGFFPLYLIFSGISPRQDAIARLTRAGWNFLIGNEASRFMRDLLDIDVMQLLERPSVTAELEKGVGSLMATIFESFAFREVAKRYLA